MQEHTNTHLQLAKDYVYYTSESVFLTGKAGTGKTTFLRTLRQDCPKQHAVLAPTGVAAINAGGTTIHSFFQLPFGPFIPAGNKNNSDESNNKHSLLARLRYGRDKRELMRSLDLLIIDEISMVRADTLDAIDTILRHIRHNEQPFGGVQMLFIGDMFQLPPVVPDQDWQILQEFYDGPFFFNSEVIRQHMPVYIELQHIYRQSDAHFIQLLNEVRNNQLTEEGLQLLNSRYEPQFSIPDDKDYITLTTHNATADSINNQALEALPASLHNYEADIEGEFSEKNFPAEQTLQLKKGAQVMFLKNDTVSKRYFNGKIGIVTSLDDERIEVHCKGDDKPISVQREVWRNVQYSLNKTLQQVEEKEIGSFTQYPLRLAWAVTIHKSQGLTFEHAIIDAAKSFSAGQVYVALSRCKTLEGMVLRTPVPPQAVKVDGRVQQYASTAGTALQLQQAFAASRNRFQLQLLQRAFDALPLQKAAAALASVINNHAGAYGEAAESWIKNWQAQIQQLAETSNKFQQQLAQLTQGYAESFETHVPLQDRIQKAADWFGAQLDGIIKGIREQPAVTDSKELAEEFEAALAEALKAATQWQLYMQACHKGYDTHALLRAKSTINIKEVIGQAYTVTKRQHAYADVPHPQLFQQVKQLRDQICADEGKPAYMVANLSTLMELVTYLPQNEKELLLITGFGKQKVEQYGTDFLALIVAYCEAHDLSSHITDKTPKRQRKEKTDTPAAKIPTQVQSLQLLQQGMSVAEIAAARGLQPGTIEGHLLPYVLDGSIDKAVLITEALFQQIAEVQQDTGTTQAAEVRQILGDHVSYNQARLVIEWLRKEGKLNENTTPSAEANNPA